MTKENNKLPPSKPGSDKPRRYFLAEAIGGPIICAYPASPEVAPMTERQRILRNLMAIEDPGEQASELKKLIKSCRKELEEMQDLYDNNRTEYYKKYCPYALMTREERAERLRQVSENIKEHGAKSKKTDNNPQEDS